jgi:hypothetical protein
MQPSWLQRCSRDTVEPVASRVANKLQLCWLLRLFGPDGQIKRDSSQMTLVVLRRMPRRIEKLTFVAQKNNIFVSFVQLH